MIQWDHPVIGKGSSRARGGKEEFRHHRFNYWYKIIINRDDNATLTIIRPQWNDPSPNQPRTGSQRIFDQEPVLPCHLQALIPL